MSLSGQPMTHQQLAEALAIQKRQIVDEVIEAMRGIETRLLREFHAYTKGQSLRLHTIDTVNSDVLARVALIEDRLIELEGHIRPKQ